MDHFEELVGQDAVKRKLNFYLDAFRRTGRIPFLFFNAPKGSGKTAFAEAMIKAMNFIDEEERQRVVYNGSSISSNKFFFETLCVHRILNSGNVTLFIDEAHNIAKDVQQALLTICDVRFGNVREYEYDDQMFTFDFNKIAFIFATTEPDKVFPPLRDRFEHVDFTPYNNADLAKILISGVEKKGFTVEDATLEDIVTHLRGSPRYAVKYGNNIIEYCKAYGISCFSQKEWEELKFCIDIAPQGLRNNEIAVLRVLNQYGPQTLTGLSAHLGMSRTAIQQDVELFLLRSGLMQIDVKRKITSAGKKVLESC